MSTKDDAHSIFTSVYGDEPEGIWSAPGRANLIGEHTDYNDGLALPFAINYRTFAAVSPRSDRLIHVWSEAEATGPISWSLDDAPPKGQGWASYPLGVISLMSGDHARGLDIAISSDVPLGAGLSSSAALECAIAVAVREVWDTQHTDTELAAIGTDAENNIVGAPTGTMDQLASMLSRKDHALAIDFHSGHTHHVPLAVDDHGLSVVIVDSGQRHDHATGGYKDRRAVCDSLPVALGVSSLRDISLDTLSAASRGLSDEQARLLTHVVTENQRVTDTIHALEEGDFTTVGQQLTTSHRSLRDDFRVSTDFIDTLVEGLEASGALGARLCGGGFGGSVIALIPHGRVEQARSQVATMARAPHASHPPTFRVVTAEDGAGKT